ncbi:MAG: hypothetical protein ACLFRP_00295 [Puniceicoccaceae bacterium]
MLPLRPIRARLHRLFVSAAFLLAPFIAASGDEAADQGQPAPFEVWTSFTLHELRLDESDPDFFHLRFRMSLSWDPEAAPGWEPEDDIHFYNTSGEVSRHKVSGRGKGTLGEKLGPDFGRVEIWLVEGNFKGYHDYRGFPVDQHELGVILLSRTLGADQIRFVSAPENLDLRAALPARIEGWEVRSLGFHDGSDRFLHSIPVREDGGEPAFAGWEISVERDLSYAAVAIFLPMVLIWFFSYLGFFWSDSSPASRFGTAAIFAAIAFTLGTRRLTPDVGYLLALDAGFFGLYLCIAVNALWVAAIFRLRNRGETAPAEKLRRAGIRAAPVLAALAIGLSLLLGAAADSDSFFDGRPPVIRPLD